MLQHLPNAITVSRGLAGPAIAYALVVHGANRVGFWIFLAAIVTDLIDGFVARQLSARSALGRWLDPMADKMLSDATWAALWWTGLCPWWLAAWMLGRDGIVIAGSIWAMRSGRKWETKPSGQVMVAFEGVSLCLLLFHGPWLDVHWPTVGTVVGCISGVLSISSMLEYATNWSPRPQAD